MKNYQFTPTESRKARRFLIVEFLLGIATAVFIKLDLIVLAIVSYAACIIWASIALKWGVCIWIRKDNR